MASISFKHVEKTYPGNVTVVPDLNLEIQDKGFVILVDPSGCGKTGDYVLAAAAQGSLTVSALAYSLLLKLRAMPQHSGKGSGFANANYFSKVFRKETGMSPSKYLESAPCRPGGGITHLGI